MKPVKKRLIWQLYPSYLLITLISLAAVSLYASNSLRDFFVERKSKDVEVRARLLEELMEESLFKLEKTKLDSLCKRIGRSASTRLTVILSDGTVAGDSEENPDLMDYHGSRPEVVKALRGETGLSIRYSRTLQQRMLYVAIPLEAVEERAVLRASIPLTEIDNAVRSVRIRIGFAGFLIALLASGICLYVSRRISKPIEDMRQGAAQFAQGNLKHRLAAPETIEMAGLAETMNIMAAQLRERMKTIVDQSGEIESILSSMLEGVIAVDTNERVLKINPAAANMFRMESNTMRNRDIREIIRSTHLIDIVGKTLSSGEIAEGDISLHTETEKILNTRCTPLWDSNGKRIGALIVFQDVTKLRRLENIRKDFVANVSHEIKTPLTAIKGFVETLRQGAMENPDEAERFLCIIEKHSNRLEAVIEDLLQLSRLEREEQTDRINLEKCKIMDVIRAAVQICEGKANEKGIRIEASCRGNPGAMMDKTLMEQAFVNLLDNAVKYSGENSEIVIHASRTDSGLSISFKDFGIGIGRNHLPRLFERFYRVDKARSRKLGGTGLGLAIVKHIVRAHGGSVSVDSTLGKGSVFTVHLPSA